MILKNFFNETSWMLSECQSQDSKTTILVKGFKYFIKYVIPATILATAISIICKLCGIPFEHALSSDNFEGKMQEHLFLMLSIVVIFVPFLEESIFRFWQSYKKWQFAILLFLVAYEILANLIPVPESEAAFGVINGKFVYLAPVKIIASALIAASIYFVPQQKFTDFGKRYGTVCALVSAIAFALLHATNYECPLYAIPLAMLCCAPQFVFGTTATYYRRNLGFLYGVALHMLNNGIIFVGCYMGAIMQHLS